MRYKINISDYSFLIVDEDTTFNVFSGFIPKKHIVTAGDILNDYGKYYLIDKINKKIKRKFNIEETNSDLPCGRYKLSQNIKVGDLLISPDGSPVVVKELHTGIDDMYEIMVEGKPYIVNGGHILALVDKTTGEHIEIPVNIYINMDDEFKKNVAMWRET